MKNLKETRVERLAIGLRDRNQGWSGKQLTATVQTRRRGRPSTSKAMTWPELLASDVQGLAVTG